MLEVETKLELPERHPTIIYSDSKDVLACIQNDSPKEQTPRYIVSRINSIRKIPSLTQWVYIPTANNPADIGTRLITVKGLLNSPWLTGPQFLKTSKPKFTQASSYFLSKNKSATEDITSGSKWENMLQTVKTQHNSRSTQPSRKSCNVISALSWYLTVKQKRHVFKVTFLYYWW